MKYLSILIACLVLAACETTSPVPKPPAVAGMYVIREFDANRNVVRAFDDVESYVHTFFPPSIAFDVDGQRIELKGSWDIIKKP